MLVTFDAGVGAFPVNLYSTACEGTEVVKIKLHSFLVSSLSAEVNCLSDRPTPFSGEIAAVFVTRSSLLQRPYISSGSKVILYTNNAFKLH